MSGRIGERRERQECRWVLRELERNIKVNTEVWRERQRIGRDGVEHGFRKRCVDRETEWKNGGSMRKREDRRG